MTTAPDPHDGSRVVGDLDGPLVTIPVQYNEKIQGPSPVLELKVRSLFFHGREGRQYLSVEPGAT